MLPAARSLSAPLSCLNEARFGIVFGALGAARDSLESAIAYANSRDVFDRPLSSFQLTQEKFANMTLKLGKGLLLALHLGRMKNDGESPRSRSASASPTTFASPSPSPGSVAPSSVAAASPSSTLRCGTRTTSNRC